MFDRTDQPLNVTVVRGFMSNVYVTIRCVYFGIRYEWPANSLCAGPRGDHREMFTNDFEDWDRTIIPDLCRNFAAAGWCVSMPRGHLRRRQIRTGLPYYIFASQWCVRIRIGQ